jgi:hypothetical protein
VWPIPHYFSLVPRTEKPLLESCLIKLIDNTEHTGYLIEFSPEKNNVLFLPENSTVNEIISIDQILNLQLLWSMKPVKDEKIIELSSHNEFRQTSHQTYKIELTNKIDLVGDTCDYVKTEAGLFLYPYIDDETIVRYFIPHRSILSCKIGMHTGELLIKERFSKAHEIESALERQKELRQKRLGDYLIEHQVVSAEQLEQAIIHQGSRPTIRIGEALIELKLLTDEELEVALNKQKNDRTLRLGQILINMGIISEHNLKSVLAIKLGIPFVNLSKFNLDANAIGLVKVSLAIKLTLIPLFVYQHKLVVCFEDPINIKAIDELSFVTQMKVIPVMATQEDILQAIKKYYGYALSWSEDEYQPIQKNSDGSIEFKL